MKTPSLLLAASLVTTLACSRPAPDPLTDAGAPSGGVDAGAMTPDAGVTERCDDPVQPLRRIGRRAFGAP